MPDTFLDHEHPPKHRASFNTARLTVAVLWLLSGCAPPANPPPAQATQSLLASGPSGATEGGGRR